MSAIVLTNFKEVSLSVTTEATLAKAQAIEGTKAIAEITDATGQQAAVDALARARRFTKRLEESRSEVKAPVLKLGKDIDAKAKEFAAEVEAEIERVKKLLDAYVREEDRKAAEAQRMRDAIAAKKREREEAAAKAAEEEKKRLEAEAAKAEDAEQAEDLRKAAENAAWEAEQAKLRSEAATAAKPAAVIPRASGMSAKPVWKYRVTDIAALYAARPDLCELTDKPSLINAAIRTGGERNIPGLEIFEEIETSIRA